LMNPEDEEDSIRHAYNDGMCWHENVGDLSSPSYRTDSTFIYNYSVSWREVTFADFDGDGDTDFLAYVPLPVADGVNASDYESKWTVFENSGLWSGDFTLHVITGGSGDVSRNAASGDLDGDGLEDIVVIRTGSLRWIKNLGDMQFSEVVLISSWRRLTNSILIADLDQDSDLDVLVTYNEVAPSNATLVEDYDFWPILSWFENSGNGTFLTEHIIFMGEIPRPLISYGASPNTMLADFNGDSLLDVAGAFGQFTGTGTVDLYDGLYDIITFLQGIW